MSEFLGKRVKDKITGYTGIVTAYCVYLYEGGKVLVEWIDSTGRPIEWWFNIQRIEVL